MFDINPRNKSFLDRYSQGELGRFAIQSQINYFDSEYAEWAVDSAINKLLLEKIKPVIGKRIFLHDFMLHTYPDRFDSIMFRLTIDVDEVREIPVVFKVVTEKEQLPKDVYYCVWCDGYTKNDSRGQCSACGGPRQRERK